ncbi:hypothetical protein MO867_22285, partial [Microbulbifer sp. OS29]
QLAPFAIAKCVGHCGNLGLTTKIALLVAVSTLVLLGSYYVLSMISARNAIIDFQDNSSITIGEALTDDEKILADIQNKQPTSDINSLLVFLE